jgi:hypothetical protein
MSPYFCKKKRGINFFVNDETLRIINKPKHQKGGGGDTRNKMEGPISKKSKE